MKLRDGEFRLSVCEHGHVTLGAVDAAGVVSFVSVMSRREATRLAFRLRCAAGTVREPMRGGVRMACADEPEGSVH